MNIIPKHPKMQSHSVDERFAKLNYCIFSNTYNNFSTRSEAFPSGDLQTDNKHLYDKIPSVGSQSSKTYVQCVFGKHS